MVTIKSQKALNQTIVGDKTHWIKELFVPLKNSWNLDV
jgi:hypothetical protein